MKVLYSVFVFEMGIPFLGKYGRKKYKLLDLAKIWSLGQLEYAEFNGGVQFFFFRKEVHFLGKVSSKNNNFKFKLKFST